MDHLPYSSYIHHNRQLAALLLFLVVLSGCSTFRQVVPPEPVSPPPTEYQPITGPAAALYTEAETALRAGRFVESEMLLERALRIEPRNAHYWYTMAQVKYRRGQYAETVQFCKKAESLAGKQPQLLARNRELLWQAQKALQQ
jgi:tetratricopeptide (TPR) repeat protein